MNKERYYKPEYKGSERDCYSVADLPFIIENELVVYGLATSYSKVKGLTVSLNCKEKHIDITIPNDLIESNGKVFSDTLIGKYIGFVLTDEKTGNRKRAQELCQEEYVSKLHKGDVINACIASKQPYGIFCDIGCGIVALLHSTKISVIRVDDCRTVFKNTTNIRAVVNEINEDGKIQLSMREILGTWQEETDYILENSEVLIGEVLAVEEYGAFVALTQNLVGLAEPVDFPISKGDAVAVRITKVNPDKSKVKLLITSRIDNCTDEVKSPLNNKYRYYANVGDRIEYWNYNERCQGNEAKGLITDFRDKEA